MNIIELEKKRMKTKKHTSSNNYKNQDEIKNYVDKLITRLLVSLILFFSLIIISNTSNKANKFIEQSILTDHIAFSQVTNYYKKHFGNILPFENFIKEDQTVFSEQFSYESIVNYKDGYEIKVQQNYLIPVIASGIVVFIGEKEGLGNTIIVQGIDEIDYWYSNVTNIPATLYDYVTKGSMLGSVDGNKMYLTFKKGSEYLEYNEIFK